MPTTRLHQPLLSTAFLRSVWATEFEAFTGSPLEAEIRDRLFNWRDRRRLKETSAEQTFVDRLSSKCWSFTVSSLISTGDLQIPNAPSIN